MHLFYISVNYDMIISYPVSNREATSLLFFDARKYDDDNKL